MSNPIKLRPYRSSWGEWTHMSLTCGDHPEFDWTFDFERVEPGEWETALTIAYGHWFYAHGVAR